MVILAFMVKLSKVNAQQVPHPGEPNPVTAEAPPMSGKWGKEPKVVKFLDVNVPEHATVSSDWFELS
jgi:hypothetical protein